MPHVDEARTLGRARLSFADAAEIDEFVSTLVPTPLMIGAVVSTVDVVVKVKSPETAWADTGGGVVET